MKYYLITLFARHANSPASRDSLQKHSVVRQRRHIKKIKNLTTKTHNKQADGAESFFVIISSKLVLEKFADKKENGNRDSFIQNTTGIHFKIVIKILINGKQD